MFIEKLPVFIGRGTKSQLNANKEAGPPWDGPVGPWRRRAGEDASDDVDHPEGYVASPELAHAVNTAIILGKPLLVTGSPGTGKSQLADRVAWEFNLSPVLRFEAQSMSESPDLFYRYDLVAQLGAVEMMKARVASGHAATTASGDTAPLKEIKPEHFITFGPLGEAILRAAPQTNVDLWPIGLPDQYIRQPAPRPSVVLIDEIDKASRDFPNDLLNGIERLEFRIREKQDKLVCAPKSAQLRPIVIITSNSERELPDPFLRRCVYFHIDEPSSTELRNILLRRVFPEHYRDRSDDTSAGSAKGEERSAMPLFEDLLKFFLHCRKSVGSEMHYRSGTSELIDWGRVLRLLNANFELNIKGNIELVNRALSCMAKHHDDRVRYSQQLDEWVARS
jgi:MoxR-like ATPase